MLKATKVQKYLAIGAVLFVVVYIVAIVLTVQSRLEQNDQRPRITSAKAIEEERYLILPELLLPMGILLALAISYFLIKRRNVKTYQRLDDEYDDSPWPTGEPPQN